MKIKINPFKDGKKVYYFDHRYGVLQDKGRLKYKIFSSLITALFIFGGTGFAVSKFADYSQHKQATAALQRQSVQVDTNQKDEEPNKLKDAVPKAREDEQLAKQIKDKLKNVPGGQKWSVYVRDVKSDRMASINADDSFEAANLSNLFMVAPLEAKIPAANWAHRGGKQTLTKCVEAMINSSDLDCAQSVSRSADIKNAHAVNSSLGFKKTHMNEKEQKTTPRETGDLLFRLQKGQIVSDKARRIVFDGLYGQKMREGIPAGCVEPQCLIANIAADSKGVKHDAAILTTDKAQFVVVIMSNNGASWSQMSDVSAAIRLAMQP